MIVRAVGGFADRRGFATEAKSGFGFAAIEGHGAAQFECGGQRGGCGLFRLSQNFDRAIGEFASLCDVVDLPPRPTAERSWMKV